MDIRDAIGAGFDKVDQESEPVVESTQGHDAPVESAPVEQPSQGRARDQSGRFTKPEPQPEPTAPLAPVLQAEQPPVPPPINRPSTWRKEYWPLFDKLSTGQPLTAEEAKQIADYTHERETQFKAGVSTYKAEAEAARDIQQAIAPYMSEVQKYGVTPGQFFGTLGRAHLTLVNGSPQEKLLMFQKMANQYGVPLSAFAQMQDGQTPQFDPNVQMLHGELAQTKAQVNSLHQFVEQMQLKNFEQMFDEFKRAPGHEHVDAVMADMTRLLETRIAQNLNDAYDKAVRLNPEVSDLIQQQKQAQATSQAQAVAAKAKAAAVSPRSASPSTPATSAPKGLRAGIENAFESVLGSGGRV